MASFLNATKIDVATVPYNGAPPAILDLMANRVQFMMSPIVRHAAHRLGRPQGIGRRRHHWLAAVRKALEKQAYSRSSR
jgi:hypothetical protein